MQAQPLRLNWIHWLFVILGFAIFHWVSPSLFENWEDFSLDENYRTPTALSRDYFHFERAITATVNAAQNKGTQQASNRDSVSVDSNSVEPTFVLGDSVVWGEYVDADQTVVAHLNRLETSKDSSSKKAKFVNASIQGLHPLAIEGLVRHYGEPFENHNVIFQCNLLWMSTKARDLQVPGVPFNHEKLIPQFASLPAYQVSVEERLARSLGNRIDTFQVVDHIRQAYFDNYDLHRWSLQHPWKNPASQFTRELPAGQVKTSRDDKDWQARNIKVKELLWFSDSEKSNQWRATTRLLNRLQRDSRKLLVVIGPINEHMLTGPSQQSYQKFVREVEDWLRENELESLTIPNLDSEDYADLSHPLSTGYQKMALRISNRIK